MQKIERCPLCKDNYATEVHHLIFGRQYRKLCDEDSEGFKTTLRICRDCHNAIHNNGVAAQLSKMLGQALWESNYCDTEHELVRMSFRERYGRSWL